MATRTASQEQGLALTGIGAFEFRRDWVWHRGYVTVINQVICDI